MRTAIDVSAIAELKRYATPPTAVVTIMTATLTLLAEVKQVSVVGTLPPINIDRAKLADWKGVRSLLHSIDYEAVVLAIAALVPSQIPPKVWSTVSTLLEQANLKEAMRCSQPLAALYCWVKCARLLATPELLLQSVAGHS